MDEGNTPLPDVLESSEYVVRRARFVSIDEQAVQRWAAANTSFQPADATAFDELTFRGCPTACANYALLVDSLNFCFWSDEPWEVDYRGRAWTRTPAMMAAVLRAIARDPRWLTAKRWLSATDGQVEALFHGRGRIPLIARRAEILRETGLVLLERHGGRFATAVEFLGHSARRIAYHLAESFPSFCDVATYGGREVPFLKRAQICAADLHRIRLANGQTGLSEMDRLTVFADYRLPQLFRHERLLRLDEQIAGRIDRGELLEAGSPAEVELRAATIWIGKLLCDALGECGRRIAPWELDYELWQRARHPSVTVAHHRTITSFY